VQTRRLATYFEPLNRSLPLLVPVLHTRKAMCDPVVLVRESSILTGHQSVKTLTRSLPFYEYIVLGNWEEPGIFWLTYPPHSSSADWARERLKPPEDLASL